MQDTLHARRKAAEIVRGDGVMHKLFTEFAARYKDREGGYTRILQTRRRPNDCAQMAYIECALGTTAGYMQLSSVKGLVSLD